MKSNIQYFETIIIGTGFSGLLAAIGLQKKQFNNFILLEKEANMGGTWQANSYPGAEVDIPTGLYSISFIPYKFKKRYAPQSELLEYTNYIIDKFNIRKHTKTNQDVKKLSYNEGENLWYVEVTTGERYTAKFIIDTSGVLANPKTPHINGEELFQGDKFHTATWNHNVNYKGKQVGIIGSGCSSAQVVSAIANEVKTLTVFMGTPEWIIPRSDRNYSNIERSIMNFPIIRHLNRFMIFASHEVKFIGFKRYPFTSKIRQFIKYLYAQSLKNNLNKYIGDDNLREYMMPNYELGSRRVIPSNSYLPALSQKNVNVEIKGIDKITSTGIRTKSGKDIPLDIIVYATGFFAYSNIKKLLPFQIYGLNNRHLNAEWEIDTTSYKGITVSGYPNYFKINGPNTGSGHSSQLCYMEVMVNYTIQAICAVNHDKKIKSIDVKKEVQDKYLEKTRNSLKKTVWQNSDCKAFYRKNMTGVVTSLSPESVIHFIFSRKNFNLKDYNLLK